MKTSRVSIINVGGRLDVMATWRIGYDNKTHKKMASIVVLHDDATAIGRAERGIPW